MKKFSLLTPDNVETVYSLVYIISEVDYTSDVCGEIVKLAISDVLPWICDNQTKITSNDEDIEKYDFLVLVLLVLFCKTTMTEKMKNIVQQVRKVYGSEAGEITEYCDKLLN
ncbi:hypothetical protein EHI_027230 [Entamoeba histolytica HM-1:IMSS]|uniref:Uncharacterized protein n=2 Tax=Entamoeba TaxID=5758 RepID=B1N5Y8_ENTH1|nr:hypothetical protein EHI_027230 [Entamoeba histolytica HM-1:IMSS]EDS88620.1 hypothetical protein EHI_027230 [Entamoeba histolytica HM-1:IMSS]|eukprot:XP_001914604.1 hypothetical protein EHI_027230 [Entamoeba histolytica HM-1:IMSS]